MKRSIIIILALAMGFSASAQTALDGLIFSEKNYVGTARTLAMGNAFTALGGDIGAMDINPASTAVCSSFQTTLTLGCNTSISVAQGTTLPGADSPYAYGDRIRTSDSKAVMPNIGFVSVYNSGNSSGLKRITLGVSVNASNYIHNRLFANGNHYGTSLAGYMATYADGPYSSLTSKDAYELGNYAWDAIVSAQSGMIAPMSGSENEYVGITEKYTTGPNGTSIYTAGPLNQKYGRLVDGKKKEVVFNAGIDLNDWIYLGVNMGFNTIKYKQEYYIQETAVDPGDFEVNFSSKGSVITTNFNDLKYNYSYDAKGSGIYGKFGVILTPGRFFRFGATVQTPAITTVTEHWQVAGETNFTNSEYNSSSCSNTGEQQYAFREPWRTSVGVASTFGKLGLVSLDYEASFYNSMRFSVLDEASYDYFYNVNCDIKDYMTVQHNVRLGTEFRAASWLSVRGGYNLITSAFKGDSSVKQAVCAGLGFNFGEFMYFDIASKALFYPVEYIQPYGDYIYNGNTVEVASPEIRHWSALVSTIATLGFRF